MRTPEEIEIALRVIKQSQRVARSLGNSMQAAGNQLQIDALEWVMGSNNKLSGALEALSPLKLPKNGPMM